MLNTTIWTPGVITLMLHSQMGDLPLSPGPINRSYKMWSYSRNGERYNGKYPTAVAAAAEGFAENKECDHLYLGRCVVPPREVDVDNFIDNMACQTTEEAGEWGEDYLMHVPKELEKDLKDRLQVAFDSWEKEHGMEPLWWNVLDPIVVYKGQPLPEGLDLNDVAEESPVESVAAELIRVKEENSKLLKQAAILKAINRGLKAGHQFCPDCRDKVANEPCLRCQKQALQSKLDRETELRKRRSLGAGN